MSIITLLTPRRPFGLRLPFGRTTQPVAIPQTAPAAEPTNLYTPDEMPLPAEIEAAAAQYAKAVEQARAGDRGKRAAKKILDRLPAGLYGGWLVRRETSNRQAPDMEAIRATYARLGLGPVPMKPAAPSLKIERVAVDESVAV